MSKATYVDTADKTEATALYCEDCESYYEGKGAATEHENAHPFHRVVWLKTEVV